MIGGPEDQQFAPENRQSQKRKGEVVSQAPIFSAELRGRGVWVVSSWKDGGWRMEICRPK